MPLATRRRQKPVSSTRGGDLLYEFHRLARNDPCPRFGHRASSIGAIHIGSLTRRKYFIIHRR
jgi:hypothetical protein